MDRFFIQVPRYVPRFQEFNKDLYYYLVPRVSRLFTLPNRNTPRVSSSPSPASALSKQHHSVRHTSSHCTTLHHIAPHCNAPQPQTYLSKQHFRTTILWGSKHRLNICSRQDGQHLYLPPQLWRILTSRKHRGQRKWR